MILRLSARIAIVIHRAKPWLSIDELKQILQTMHSGSHEQGHPDHRRGRLMDNPQAPSPSLLRLPRSVQDDPRR